eukprot:SAG31_NODE_16004_length_727_cov_1.732484_1_plen_42_part_00
MASETELQQNLAALEEANHVPRGVWQEATAEGLLDETLLEH